MRRWNFRRYFGLKECGWQFDIAKNLLQRSATQLCSSYSVFLIWHRFRIPWYMKRKYKLKSNDSEQITDKSSFIFRDGHHPLSLFNSFFKPGSLHTFPANGFVHGGKGTLSRESCLWSRSLCFTCLCGSYLPGRHYQEGGNPSCTFTFHISSPFQKLLVPVSQPLTSFLTLAQVSEAITALMDPSRPERRPLSWQIWWKCERNGPSSGMQSDSGRKTWSAPDREASLRKLNRRF